MTFILTIGHRKISTKSKNKKRGNNDSRYSGSKTNNSTEISNGTVISISYCTHGDNYKPKTVFKDHEIRLVVSLAEGNHLTKSNYKAHIKKDQKSQRFVLEKTFNTKKEVILGTVDSAQSAGSGITINRAGNQGQEDKVDAQLHDYLKYCVE